LPEVASFRSRFGTPVVQQALARSGHQFLSVRECARVLRVSTATVYRAVASGEIPHVRVSNAIRIPVAPRG